MTVTVQTDSRGTGTVTNTSTTWHYKGELKCVTTCPGPGPTGCSVTDSVTTPKELAPSGIASCIMIATTDPCCNDDGEFVLGTQFKVTHYRGTATDPWSEMIPERYKQRIGINEDAGPGNPVPDASSGPSPGGLHLNVECGIPGTDVPEARVRVVNGHKKHGFRVRFRSEAVCPSDETFAICTCPGDIQGQPGCGVIPPGCQAFDPNGRQVVSGNCHTYPEYSKQFSECGADNWCPRDDPNTAQVEYFELLQDDAVGRDFSPLNDCCDCLNVKNIVLCGELDTIEVMKANQQDFEPLTSGGFDKSGKCQKGDHPASKHYQCFSDPNAFCADPL